MAPEQSRSLALMDVSIALLHEAYDRLESLCRILPNSKHRDECSETARHIHAHLRTLDQQVTALRGGGN